MFLGLPKNVTSPLTTDSIDNTKNVTSNVTSNIVSNITDDSLTDYQVRKLLAQMLLNSITPLTNNIASAVVSSIAPIIADYMIQFRHSVLEGNEFRSIPNASKISNIPYNTIYNWISNKMLQLYIMDNKQCVSMTELNSLLSKKKGKYLTKKSITSPYNKSSNESSTNPP